MTMNKSEHTNNNFVIYVVAVKGASEWQWVEVYDDWDESSCPSRNKNTL